MNSPSRAGCLDFGRIMSGSLQEVACGAAYNLTVDQSDQRAKECTDLNLCEHTTTTTPSVRNMTHNMYAAAALKTRAPATSLQAASALSAVPVPATMLAPVGSTAFVPAAATTAPPHVAAPSAMSFYPLWTPGVPQPAAAVGAASVSVSPTVKMKPIKKRKAKAMSTLSEDEDEVIAIEKSATGEKTTKKAPKVQWDHASIMDLIYCRTEEARDVQFNAKTHAHSKQKLWASVANVLNSVECVPKRTFTYDILQ